MVLPFAVTTIPPKPSMATTSPPAASAGDVAVPEAAHAFLDAVRDAKAQAIASK